LERRPAVVAQDKDQAATTAATTKSNRRKDASKAGKKGVGKNKNAKKQQDQGTGISDNEEEQGPDPAVVAQVMAVQDRNSANLMSQKGVAGTATALDEDGNVVIRVYTTGADEPQLPKFLENIPVQVVLSGPIHPWRQKPKKQAAPPAAKSQAPKTKLPPPPPAPVLLPDPPRSSLPFRRRDQAWDRDWGRARHPDRRHRPLRRRHCRNPIRRNLRLRHRHRFGLHPQKIDAP